MSFATFFREIAVAAGSRNSLQVRLPTLKRRAAASTAPSFVTFMRTKPRRC